MSAPKFIDVAEITDFIVVKKPVIIADIPMSLPFCLCFQYHQVRLTRFAVINRA